MKENANIITRRRLPISLDTDGASEFVGRLHGGFVLHTCIGLIHRVRARIFNPSVLL